MRGWLWAVLAGTATGVLSGFGVGGGSLLLLYMTTFGGTPQQLAQGINLLYFLPTAGAALPFHLRRGDVARPVLLPAICGGLVCTGITAWAATALNTDLLRRLYGGFLLLLGLRELFRKPPADGAVSSPQSGGSSDTPPK